MQRKRVLRVSAVVFALAAVFCLSGVIGGYGYGGKTNSVYAATDTRTGIYKASYTANGKTTTEWCYLKNGKVQYSYTGFASNDGGWWYVEKGKITFKKNDVIQGTVKGQNAWWYVKGSKVQFTDSVEKNSGGWWVIQKGKVNFNYNGLAKRGSDWWYAKKGKVDFGYTGLCKYNGIWWYVKKGKVDFSYTGLCKYNGSWWYVVKGKVNFSYAGLCKYSGSWWYVKGGQVNFNYEGLVKYNGSWWYVKNGKVQFIDSVVKYNKGWWAVKNGKVDFSFCGFAKNSSGWWYCENGQVRFNINAIVYGAVNGKYDSWYVKNGSIQTGYSGTIKTDDYDITIKNGKAESVKIKNEKGAGDWKVVSTLYKYGNGNGVTDNTIFDDDWKGYSSKGDDGTSVFKVNGNVEEYTFKNSEGKVTEKTKTVKDSEGKLIESVYTTDYMTYNTKYEYNSKKLMTKVTYEVEYSENDKSNGTITYEYDKNGNRTYSYELNSYYYEKNYFKYDSNGNVTLQRRVSDISGGIDVSYTFKYEYDSQKRVKKVIADYNDHVETTEKSYYGNGALKSIKTTTVSNSGDTNYEVEEYSIFGSLTKSYSYGDSHDSENTVERRIMVYNLNR